MGSFIEFMSERKAINRWMVLIIGLVGAFAGCVLTIIFMLIALAG